MFFRSKKKKPASEPNLGFRSGFVLAKLGHDLREQYSDVLALPLPQEMEHAIERLRGPAASVERLDDHKRR